MSGPNNISEYVGKIVLKNSNEVEDLKKQILKLQEEKERYREYIGRRVDTRGLFVCPVCKLLEFRGNILGCKNDCMNMIACFNTEKCEARTYAKQCGMCENHLCDECEFEKCKICQVNLCVNCAKECDTCSHRTLTTEYFCINHAAQGANEHNFLCRDCK
jgi:hypothetical protein